MKKNIFFFAYIFQQQTHSKQIQWKNNDKMAVVIKICVYVGRMKKKWPKMIESTFDYFNNIERLMLDDDEDEKKRRFVCL